MAFGRTFGFHGVTIEGRVGAPGAIVNSIGRAIREMTPDQVLEAGQLLPPSAFTLRRQTLDQARANARQKFEEQRSGGKIGK